jgi:hypothetical protein
VPVAATLLTIRVRQSGFQTCAAAAVHTAAATAAAAAAATTDNVKIEITAAAATAAAIADTLSSYQPTRPLPEIHRRGD